MSVEQFPSSGPFESPIPGGIDAGRSGPASVAKSPEPKDQIGCVHVRGIGAVERVLAPPLCFECGPGDESLEHGLAAGDDRAFALLVDRETANVFQICYRVLGNREDAPTPARASLRYPRTR